MKADLGRQELINVKAFQVAPAELEVVPLEHDDIADAAAVGLHIWIPRIKRD